MGFRAGGAESTSTRPGQEVWARILVATDGRSRRMRGGTPGGNHWEYSGIPRTFPWGELSGWGSATYSTGSPRQAVNPFSGALEKASPQPSWAATRGPSPSARGQSTRRGTRWRRPGRSGHRVARAEVGLARGWSARGGGGARPGGAAGAGRRAARRRERRGGLSHRVLHLDGGAGCCPDWSPRAPMCLHHVQWVRELPGELRQRFLGTEIVGWKDVYPRPEDLTEDDRARWRAREATREAVPAAGASR